MAGKGTVRVAWDETDGFVEVTFDNVVLETDADVAWLREELIARYQTFDGPFDCLIGLDGLRLERDAVRAFGEMRGELTNQFFASSRRYGGGRLVKTAVLTSGVLYDADRDIFATRQEAVRDLRASRGQ